MSIFTAIKLLWAAKKSKKEGKKKSMEIKNFLKSKTIWGLILLLVNWLRGQFGLDIDEATLEGNLNAVINMIGWALAFYGRWKAKKPLTVKE